MAMFVCFLQGLRFLHLPYLLTLQLKRFDFDYTTMHRIKLNDRMTFPEELDMSSFIDVEDEVRERFSQTGKQTILHFLLFDVSNVFM